MQRIKDELGNVCCLVCKEEPLKIKELKKSKKDFEKFPIKEIDATGYFGEGKDFLILEFETGEIWSCGFEDNSNDYRIVCTSQAAQNLLGLGKKPSFDRLEKFLDD